MKKNFYIIANWKMNVFEQEARGLVRVAREARGRLPKKYQMILCPSFPYLGSVHRGLQNSGITLGAQDVFFEALGPFTGQVSPRMLREFGCEYVILGHSERRKMGEDDATVGKKVAAVLKEKLIPIVCVGENDEDRVKGRAEEVVQKQVERIFRNISLQKKDRFIVAYEPVWAISTSRKGAEETPEDANEKQGLICEMLRKRFGTAGAKRAQVIYGGSVDADNVAAFAKKENIMGVLVGSASQKTTSFSRLIQSLICE